MNKLKRSVKSNSKALEELEQQGAGQHAEPVSSSLAVSQDSLPTMPNF